MIKVIEELIEKFDEKINQSQKNQNNSVSFDMYAKAYKEVMKEFEENNVKLV
jgi:hypothetical protein